MTVTARTRPRGTRPRRSTGWVPHQHGAWAMLITPFALGAVVRIGQDGWVWYLLPLFACWVVGYFAFAAASLWLKSRRSPRYLPPLITYASTAGVCGLLSLASAGPALLTWAAVYAPLILLALWLVAHKRERSTLSGFSTVLAASLMAVTATHPDPATATRPGSWWIAGVCLAYFFGTVLYVKTLIRERGHRSWLIGSVAYHALVTAASTGAALTGALPWAWPVFFAATTARALLVPTGQRRVTPKEAGIGEIVLTSILAALSLVFT